MEYFMCSTQAWFDIAHTVTVLCIHLHSASLYMFICYQQCWRDLHWAFIYWWYKQNYYRDFTLLDQSSWPMYVAIITTRQLRFFVINIFSIQLNCVYAGSIYVMNSNFSLSRSVAVLLFCCIFKSNTLHLHLNTFGAWT